MMDVLGSTLGGKPRGNGLYTMEYTGSNNHPNPKFKTFQQNLHLDEASTMEKDGITFHSYNFFSLLRAVGAARSVKILTLTKEGKFQVEQVVIQVDEWLILGPGVWHAGDTPYDDVKSKLLFLYYENEARRVVDVAKVVANLTLTDPTYHFKLLAI